MTKVKRAVGSDQKNWSDGIRSNMMLTPMSSDDFFVADGWFLYVCVIYITVIKYAKILLLSVSPGSCCFS